MMQWIPNRYRNNEIRLRYTERAYKRGVWVGVAMTTSMFCVLITLGWVLL